MQCLSTNTHRLSSTRAPSPRTRCLPALALPRDRPAIHAQSAFTTCTHPAFSLHTQMFPINTAREADNLHNHHMHNKRVTYGCPCDGMWDDVPSGGGQSPVKVLQSKVALALHQNHFLFYVIKFSTMSSVTTNQDRQQLAVTKTVRYQWCRAISLNNTNFQHFPKENMIFKNAWVLILMT